MRRRGGRRIAAACGLLGLLALVALALACRDQILERYWLWRLETGDQAEWGRAAEALGRLRTVVHTNFFPEEYHADGRMVGTEFLTEFGLRLSLNPSQAESTLSTHEKSLRLSTLPDSRALVSLRVRGPAWVREFEFLVDTGLGGALTLSAEDAAALGLTAETKDVLVIAQNRYRFYRWALVEIEQEALGLRGRMQVLWPRAR